jgi:hypothetical protein
VNDVRDFLVKRALPQSVTAGASSYFTPPEKTLDPNLFGYGEKMKLVVRTWLQHTLHGFLAGKGYHGVEHWTRIWVAGSGASYQWSAARDPGDLDVLIGIDYERFRRMNPRYTGLSDVEIGDDLNEVMQNSLWPKTANQQIGHATYEVTWYCNPHATDIRDINPYAAYDVDKAEWTVRPIELPAAGPGEWFPKEYEEAANRDQARAVEIVTAYNQARAGVTGDLRDPHSVNAAAALTTAGRHAEALFNEIHLGRHAAFDKGGQGYRDYANYRWQRGKLLGTIPALRAIHDEVKGAREDTETALYGRKLKSTEHYLVEAALGRTS